MILSAIAAVAKNRVIGAYNKLAWHLPDDLKYFRRKTKGKVMVMGRKTFDSFPKPLPDRMHIVITRTPQNSAREDVVYVSSLEKALELARSLVGAAAAKWPEEVMVIGGGEIYTQALPLLDRLYITHLELEPQGDVLFPEFSKKDFRVLEEKVESQPFPHIYTVYQSRQSLSLTRGTLS